jgi:uncharacterized protein (DUF433 family)
MTSPRADAQSPPRLPYFVPERETDPLIRRYVTLPPFGTPKNDPAVTGASGQRYPVWAVYLNYLSADGDIDLTLWNYGDDLTADQIQAVRRFAEVYPDVVMPYVNAALYG